jgi:formylglycine-generating enzyme
MKKLLVWAALIVAVYSNGVGQRADIGLVWVEGGEFKNTRSNFSGSGVSVPGFYIGKYEITQREWVEVMGSNPSEFKGDDLPVEMVSWYDCIEYCNRRSLREGLQPYYNIDKSNKDPANDNEYDEVKWIVGINPRANGYRLPTELEWEYAASGGQKSKNLLYSGSDSLEEVGWFWQNSGDQKLAGVWSWPAVQQNRGRTRPVGQKAPNELGLYDMSGNVREWCWDWLGEIDMQGATRKEVSRGVLRVWKGGGWMGGDFCCEPAFRAGHEPHSLGYDQGFRVARSK